MNFVSIQFLLLLAGALFICRLPWLRAQNALLLLASYLFYGAWDWRFLGLLWFSTVADYTLALLIDRARSARLRKRLLVVSLVLNLGVLGFFKYFGFFFHELVELAARLGWETGLEPLRILLPVGISFYTFQTIAYVVDVYRGEIKPERDLLNFSLFVVFFPQLVAGPIERARHLLPQMRNRRTFNWDKITQGGWLIAWGYFQKIAIADNMAAWVEPVFSSTRAHVPWPELLLGVYAFALQIYCDFCGYSNIARGVAHWLGFDLSRNFIQPYFADSIQDFWRRWHVTLSRWLRDYLYIPLGGNRTGHATRNLMLTMLLGGLWHGANWTFLWWGAFHGGLLAINRFMSSDKPSTSSPNGLGRALRIVGTFHLVAFGWLLFRSADMAQVFHLVADGWGSLIDGDWGDVPRLGFLIVGMAWAIVGVHDYWCLRLNSEYPLLALPLVPRTLTYTGLAVILITLGNFGSSDFIYFQF